MRERGDRIHQLLSMCSSEVCHNQNKVRPRPRACNFIQVSHVGGSPPDMRYRHSKHECNHQANACPRMYHHFKDSAKHMGYSQEKKKRCVYLKGKVKAREVSSTAGSLHPNNSKGKRKTAGWCESWSFFWVCHVSVGKQILRPSSTISPGAIAGKWTRI